MRWPIIDHNMTRTELIQEAGEDLDRELNARGLLPLSHPVYSWPDPFRGGGATLVARLAVSVPINYQEAG
jgi:hypothetical protein